MSGRFLVTGGAGFIGSHLVDGLLARAGAAASPPPGARSPRFRLAEVKVPLSTGRAPPSARVALPAMSLPPILAVRPVSL